MNFLPEFSLEAYTGLLGSFRERGYNFCSFSEAAPEKRDLVVRHDIDMSLEAALEMAVCEEALGVRAAYFVLLRTELYNPFSGEGLAALKQIVDLGHEVGLHLDASLYSDDLPSLDEAARRECNVLECMLGEKVRVISFHRPRKDLQGNPDVFGGRNHTYQPRYFHDIGYCSDSRGGWHHGHPLEHQAIAENRALQLLVHPIWWTDGDKSDVTSFLDEFALARFEKFRSALAANCEPYEPRKFRINS